MAATSGSTDHTASARETAAPRAPEFSWRRVFPGDRRQLGELRRWLAELLPRCNARDEVVSVAVELGTNAVKFTSSGRGGRFTVEISWRGETVRVAVADGGAPTEPRVIEDPLSEHGRGLLMVRALSTRVGVCGDHRGRLVWADVPWTGDRAAHEWPCPDAYEAAIHHDETVLAQRFAAVPTWFGRSTLQWWALPGPARSGGLVTAPSARELAALLDRMLGARPGRPNSAADPGTARAGDRANVRVAPVPPRIHRVRPGAGRLGAQPC